MSALSMGMYGRQRHIRQVGNWNLDVDQGVKLMKSQVTLFRQKTPVGNLNWLPAGVFFFHRSSRFQHVCFGVSPQHHSVSLFPAKVIRRFSALQGQALFSSKNLHPTRGQYFSEKPCGANRHSFFEAAKSNTVIPGGTSLKKMLEANEIINKSNGSSQKE